MSPNPAIGVFYHWLGGLASASFYVPYRGVKRWAWETFWLAGGFFSWIIAPWILASINTRDLLQRFPHFLKRFFRIADYMAAFQEIKYR